METHHDRIGLLDFGRAALGLLPSAISSLWATLKVYALTPDSHQSIGSILEHQAENIPDKDCLLFEGQRWSYRDFNAWANRIAHVLKTHGVGPGDTVGLLFENCPTLLACVAAVAKLGAVAGMLNPKQRGAVLSHSMRTIQPRLMVIGDGCLPALHSASPPQPDSVPRLWAGMGPVPRGLVDLPAACAGASTANPPSTGGVRAGAPCYFIFTSGTTGLPKASVMTHLRWLRSGYGMGQAAMRLRADDVFYCPLPFHHNNALTLCWSAVLTSGATLAMARKFSASGFWRDIRAHRATAFVYIGELCRYLLNQPPSQHDRDHRVRVVIGNGLRPEIWDAFQQRFGIEHICEFYGSSEGNLVFINAFGLPRTAGFTPLPYAIVAFDTANERPVRDARGFMRRVAVGEAGLLITEVDAGHPFDGYTDAEATEAKLLHDVFKKGDGWINSGDLVRSQGLRHIAFVDRVGDTFRWKGENVATTEVERAIGAVKGVAQASVYGVAVAHSDGRAGMAAVVLHPGAAFDGRAMAQHLGRALPVYAVPIFVRIIKAQETTGTFKLRKVELKQQGFDPALVDEPLFVLLDRDHGYQPLTRAIHRRILAGTVRW
jgi:acyl-CoA synthetase (AMP-forming)/AMP-acid ligase II